MELEEEDALYRELSQLTGREALLEHPSGALSVTLGVRLLTERARCAWLIDTIASLQAIALRDSSPNEFQLWELHVRTRWSVVLCSRSEGEAVMWRVVRDASAELRYLRLYVVSGVLHLPTERACRLLQVGENTA